MQADSGMDFYTKAFNRSKPRNRLSSEVEIRIK